MQPRAGGLWYWLVLIALASGTARAQIATDEFGIERFRLPMNSSGLLDVDWADVPGHLSWGAGAWVGFAHDPLVIYDRDMNAVDSLVGSRVTTGLVGSLGLWNRVELGLGVDIVGYQTGATSSPVMSELPGGGLGDLRAAAKLLLVGGTGGSLHVAVVPVVVVPAGSPGGYLREAGPTFAPELAVAAQTGRLRGGVNLGYAVRERVDNAGLVIDDEVFARAGLGMALGKPRDAAEVALSVSFAAPARDADENQIALAAMVGGSRRVAASLGVFVAGGVGLDNGFGVPDWRALAGVRFDGVRGDRDGDGLLGAADHCPNAGEDKDGFADDDGCPDLDNDDDGIADARDRCANEAEDRDGSADDDGCPEDDDDRDGVADARDKCPRAAEDRDGFMDDDGCVDPSGTLDGRVVDGDGRPIARASLVIAYVDHATAPTQATTGDDGKFSVAVHGGAMKVTATVADYQDAAVSTSVAANATSTIEVKLARKVRQGQLRGQVLSFDGKPLAAEVAVSGKADAKATTDGEGYFTLELPAGSFEVVVTSKGHVPQRRKINIKLDGVTVLNVDMRRGP